MSVEKLWNFHAMSKRYENIFFSKLHKGEIKTFQREKKIVYFSSELEADLVIFWAVQAKLK